MYLINFLKQENKRFIFIKNKISIEHLAANSVRNKIQKNNCIRLQKIA